VALRETNEEASRFFDFLIKSAQTADFGELYKSRYFQPWDNDFKGVSFRANAGPDNIDLKIVPHETALRDRAGLTGFGSFIGEFALRRNKSCPVGGSSWTLISSGDAISADQSYENILRFIDNLLKILDPDNIEMLRAQKNLAPEEPLNLMDMFARTFPRFSIEEKFLDIKAYPVIKTFDGVRYTDFTLRIGYNPEEFRNYFPNLAKYIKKLKGLGNVEASLRSSRGYQLAVVTVDSEGEFLQLQMCSRQGRIVPMVKPAISDTPVFDAAFATSSLDRLQFTVNAKVTGRASGLEVRVDDILVLEEYENNGNGMHLTTKMGGAFETDVSGALYGILPVGLIKIFVPVDKITRNFATVMYEANKGEGSFLKVDWNKQASARNRLSWNGGSEFWNNRYFRMGAKAFAKKFQMDDKTMEESTRLVKTAVDFLLNDLEAMQ
jgi:hypothetical protein